MMRSGPARQLPSAALPPNVAAAPPSEAATAAPAPAPAPASEEPLAPLVEASGGAVRWLEDDPTPDLRRVAADRAAARRGWLGGQRDERYVVLGADPMSPFPALRAPILLLGTLGAAWYREGR